MGAHLDVSQLVQVSNRISTSGPRVGAVASTILRKTAFDIEADAKLLVEAYDAVDTGNMMNSISTSIEGDGRFGTMTAEVGPTADYSLYVHFGTSRMAGRPFLSDAFERRYPGYESALVNAAAAEVL